MASNTCDAVRDEIDGQLAQLFPSRWSGDACLVATPLTLPDGQSVEVAILATSSVFAIRDNGVAGDTLFLGGIGSRVIASRLKAVADRHGLAVNSEDELVLEAVAAGDLADGLMRVASAVVDAIAVLFAPQEKQTTKDFDSEVERFFVRNGWRYEKTRFVEGRRRRRRIDYVLDDGPHQLLLLTFQPASARTAETRLDEIQVTADELQVGADVAGANLAVLLDDRTDNKSSTLDVGWVTTLNVLLPGRVISWDDRESLGRLVGRAVATRP